MKKPRNFRDQPFSYHQELDLVIDNLSNLGQGVGRVDGWVVFVPYALPGEKVKVRIWRNKSNYSDADIVEILEPSPNRVEPGCALFGDCGGCQYQHYSYESQLEWKSRQILEMLRRIGGIEFPVNACIGSPITYGYRSKITPHFREPPNRGNVPIGFQKADSRAIVDVPQCPIASDAINEKLTELRTDLRRGKHSFRRGATVVLRDSDQGVSTDMKAILTTKVGDLSFRFIAGEFFQNNPHVLPRMVEYVVSQAAAPGIDYLVDAYCGVGVFALCGASKFEAVHGVEVNAKTHELASQNAEVNGIGNCRFELGQAEAIFNHLDFPSKKTAVILDPPRKGCDKQFLEQLLDYGPARIIYVSCGPDTQARDAKILVDADYKVMAVQPFDLFPHTRHIENIMVFAKG
jgi:23S rRNA (uracil1939-C5)-methyltransferase/tRNA (uracil-5-)-methyltransferase